MAFYTAGATAASFGTAGILPFAGLVPPAGSGGYLWEIEIYNTSATQTEVALYEITAAGTAGSSVMTPYVNDPNLRAAAITAVGVYTGAPTLVDTGKRLWVPGGGGVAGAGVGWAFRKPLVITKGVANGYALMIPSGITGQILTYVWTWEE